MKYFFNIIFLLIVASCSTERHVMTTSCRYARNFEILSTDSLSYVVVISPHDGRHDTLRINEPMDNIICMSTSHVACLSVIGADSVITAVSGLDYISDPGIRSRNVYDIGYESSLDYERIVSLAPDIVVTYTVSSAVPPYIAKLRSFGIPVLILHDHLEDHPLARAEYMRLFGVLTGRTEVADSVFSYVEQRYEALMQCPADGSMTKKVLLNIPYGDAWYVPGKDNYMSRLIMDAGGEVLGARDGTSASRVISMEEAWMLSDKADIWLNPGHCSSREQLEAFHPLFPSFGPLKNGLPIYNNTLRMTPEGGNDFYESGAVRPDLILEDLITILSGDYESSLNYFKPLNQNRSFIPNNSFSQ